MATAYYADGYNSVVKPTINGPGVIAVPFEFTMTAAFVINDTIVLTDLPKGARVLGLFIDITDVDTNTAFTCDVGDSGSATRYVNASTVGRSAGFITCPDPDGVAAAIPHLYTADDQLIFKCSAAPTGAAITTGTVKGYVLYQCNGNVF